MKSLLIAAFLIGGSMPAFGGDFLGGLIGGALGGFLGSRQQPQYYPPRYPQPYYLPDYNDAVGYCMQRYRSYDIELHAFRGYDGRWHPCP